MEAYQQRVVDEKTELDNRIRRLIDFLSTPRIFAQVDPVEQERLKLQLTHMTVYAAVLGARIANFPA